jgi:CheY-like chemotaxis protein
VVGDAAHGPVMIIEDDDDIRETLTALLADEGYRVLAHGNGAQALEALKHGARPGLILLDLMMPVMDGRQFRQAQLADPALAAIPVVLVTAAGLERVRREDYDEVLRKPVKLDRVLATVARYLDGGGAAP